MALDNNTILANLAVALAEKEEEIKKLRLSSELRDQLKKEEQIVTSAFNTLHRIEVGKTYEELEAELLAAKEQITNLKEPDVWYHRTKSANRRRKKAERMLRCCRKKRDKYRWLYEQQSEIAEEIQSKRSAAEREAEECQRKLDNITDSIDRFMRERLVHTQVRNALLVVSLQTQLKDKKKLIEEKDKLIEEKDKIIADLTQQFTDLKGAAEQSLITHP